MSLETLKKWDVQLHAFVALADAEAERGSGPLSGVRAGVKDIFDVAGLPTKCGSATRADAPAALADAPVVASLRAAGAQIVGKTTTTEFAFADPTQCRNPYDLERSPGGSSSGSGAAVAAGLVDIALGTQTAGSICRPAAYCGVVGFKPSFGVLSTTGVAPMAPSFDTVGLIARNVALTRAGFDAMAPPATKQNAPPPKIDAICGLWDAETPVQQDWAAALENARLALGDVPNQALPADANAIVTAHRTVMCAEGAQAYGDMLKDGRADQLQPKFRAGLEEGVQTSPAQLADAKAMLHEATNSFWQVLDGINLVLTLPVPEGPPLLTGGTTGFQNWLAPWTVLGGPLLSLPWGMDHRSLPRAIMLAARPGHDRWLLDIAARLEAQAPPIPAPKLPL